MIEYQIIHVHHNIMKNTIYVVNVPHVVHVLYVENVLHVINVVLNQLG